MASLDAGRNLPEGTQAEKKFRNLLDTLDNRFPESRQQIGDMTVAGQELLEKNGVTVKLLEVMGACALPAPQLVKGKKYAEIVSMYALLRSMEGMTRRDAEDALLYALMMEKQ